MRQLSTWHVNLVERSRSALAGALQLAERRVPAQGLVEYSLLLLLVVLVVIGIVTVMGQTVSGLWYQRIIDAWPT